MPETEWNFGGSRTSTGTGIRVPVVLCIDTSQSMNEVTSADNEPVTTRVGELEEALKKWQSELLSQPAMRRQADIAIVRFSTNAEVLSLSEGEAPGFVPASEFRAPPLAAEGVTRLELGIAKAIEIALEYRRTLTNESHRPKIWIITDGQPTDAAGHRSDGWRSVLSAIHKGESENTFSMFAAGVHGADMEVLRELAGIGAFDLRGLPFARILEAVTLVTGSTRRGASVQEEKTDASLVVERMNRLLNMFGVDRSGGSH